MNNRVKIADRIDWIGVNDRTTHLFESMWPLPNGVAYNSYIINDQKTALLDTVKLGYSKNYVETIGLILEGKPLDYLIVNHVEPDHAGEIGDVVAHYPNVTVVGNAMTFKMLECYFGVIENKLIVKEGDVLDLGHHKLQFVFLPNVHWPEVMVSYDTTDKILFSADAFGSFGTLDGGIFDDQINFERDYESEMRRYYSNIVGEFSPFVQKAFQKLAGVEIKMICSLHGPVWRTNPAKVLGLYDKWSRMEADDAVVVLYGSMYGNTAELADYIARKIAEHGVKDIRVYDVSKTHVSYLISEIWRCKGVVIGSPTYNKHVFPLIENLTREIESRGLKDRVLGLFGNGTWAGGATKDMVAFAQRIGWESVCPPFEIRGCVNCYGGDYADKLAEAMANRILNK